MLAMLVMLFAALIYAAAGRGRERDEREGK